MARKTIVLTNDFHNTSITLRGEVRVLGKIFLSEYQTRKAQKALCGVDGCTCGDIAGARPIQVESIGYTREGTLKDF